MNQQDTCWQPPANVLALCQYLFLFLWKLNRTCLSLQEESPGCGWAELLPVHIGISALLRGSDPRPGSSADPSLALMGGSPKGSHLTSGFSQPHHFVLVLSAYLSWLWGSLPLVFLGAACGESSHRTHRQFHKYQMAIKLKVVASGN